MTPELREQWEFEKVEYEKAIEYFRHFSNLRRRDMVYVTTVQAAVLTIIGNKLLNLDLTGIILSIIAFFVLLLGLNSERRISTYMRAYMMRAKQIEEKHIMTLLHVGREETEKTKVLFSNALIFPLYYLVIIFAWLSFWGINIFR